jgi:tryptophanase
VFEIYVLIILKKMNAFYFIIIDGTIVVDSCNTNEAYKMDDSRYDHWTVFEIARSKLALCTYGAMKQKVWNLIAKDSFAFVHGACAVKILALLSLLL